MSKSMKRCCTGASVISGLNERGIMVYGSMAEPVRQNIDLLSEGISRCCPSSMLLVVIRKDEVTKNAWRQN
jgi:hypothetical protein